MKLPVIRPELLANYSALAPDSRRLLCDDYRKIEVACQMPSGRGWRQNIEARDEHAYATAAIARSRQEAIDEAIDGYRRMAEGIGVDVDVRS